MMSPTNRERRTPSSTERNTPERAGHVSASSSPPPSPCTSSPRIANGGRGAWWSEHHRHHDLRVTNLGLRSARSSSNLMSGGGTASAESQAVLAADADVIYAGRPGPEVAYRADRARLAAEIAADTTERWKRIWLRRGDLRFRGHRGCRCRLHRSAGWRSRRQLRMGFACRFALLDACAEEAEGGHEKDESTEAGDGFHCGPVMYLQMVAMLNGRRTARSARSRSACP